jgi:hypothetical protein
MYNEFLLLIFFEKLINIYNYIVLPVDTINQENIISLYSPNSPQDIIYREHCSPLFAELEIGTPTQKIPLIIKIKENDYIITSVHQENKTVSDYYINKTLYDLSDKFNHFNENKSGTYRYIESCQKRMHYYRYDDDFPIAETTCPSYETFLFYKDINMKNQIKKEKLYFDLVRFMKDNVTGVIGLNLFNDRRTSSSFLSVLKKNNLTNNYFWYFDFNSPKNEKGKLVVGALLDEIYEDKYAREDLHNANINLGYLYYTVNFQKIVAKNASGSINFEDNKCELNFDINTIVLNSEFRKFFNNTIKHLLLKRKCFNDTFYQCEDLYGYKSEHFFFYCKNEKEVKEELQKIILPIQFYSNELDYIFEITIDDLLKESGEYIFIKLLFNKIGGGCVLGRPFSLKYKFIFNPDTKGVSFYPKFKTKKGIEINWNIVLKILLIIGLCIIFAVLGIIIGKKLYGMKRKKRANEMNDDDYEYFSESKKENENENNENYLTKNEIN